MMQGFRNLVPKMFLKQEPPVLDKVVLPKNDSAWAESSAMYTHNDFEKYNPDSLIGIKGAAIYKKMMKDEQIKAVVKFKRDAITSRDFYFEINEDAKLGEAEEEKRIGISEATVNQMRGSWMDGLNGIMSAMYNGFSMTEKVFNTIQYDGATWWGIDRLRLKPFDTFTFKVDEYGNFLGVVQKMTAREQELDIKQFIHFTMNPDYDEHYGSSELNEAYRAWFSKDMAIKYRNMWLERHAGGFIQAKIKDGLTLSQADETKLKAVMANINVTTSMIVPNAVDIDISYPVNNVAYKDAIQDADMMIARALLVPNLLGVSPQGQHGSLAQSDTQLEAFLWTLEADSSRLEDALNEQLFKQLGDANFGDNNWPRIKFKPISESKKFELIKVWKDLVTAGAVQHTDTDEDHIRQLLEFPEPGEVVSSPGSPSTLSPGETPSPAQGSDDGPAQDLNKDDVEDKEEMKKDSTIIGKGRVSVEAFEAARKRVDFAAIGQASELGIETYTQKIGKTMAWIVDDVATKIKSGDLAPIESNADAIVKMKIPGKLTARLRKDVKAFLNDGYKVGTKHAEKEISSAKGEQFTVDVERAQFIEEKFFDLKSFTITGNLSDQALATMRNIILNGAKGGKSTREVIDQIYTDFASQGLISKEDAEEALGHALGVTNPTARINTIVRTNTFEAINEARHSYFTDPELGGFVQALEYSAILDSRTTQICSHLDGQVHSTNSDVWTNYRPPNHYNCRSLLIPVTELDVWTESDRPELEPQRGFV